MIKKARAIAIALAVLTGSVSSYAGSTGPHAQQCVSSTTPGTGAACAQEADTSCLVEGQVCAWNVISYSCDWVKGTVNNCTEDSDCSGPATVDTAWCYTCAGGCCCGT